ncbi:Crp/Fnr family transcriptional regulator [Undibacterium jejuense]|uniref:Crp/Fnr family transcriptional regulator n=1 Tax=Undibacterium jejuense TaxID=1344949 RepID=A0A923HJX1_9BURK|nr:Crp/Fnr family transcriptional regulator [Undibacterium jejuense]MBC3863793.1 Crp/Fnr family transcriptional regulator [Undibacterium jejuense]
MMQQTRVLMERAAGESLPDWDVLHASYQLHHFAKGQDVFSAGEWQPYIYVVRSGIVKLTYLSENGQEWIKSFIGEGDFFACPNVLIAGLKTDYFATALEDSEIEQFDSESMRMLTDQHPAWQKAIRQLLEWHIVRKELRERELLTMAPDERYKSFLKSYPNIASRIQLKDIAQYLGVTPEALSRIRKRLQM